MVTKIDKVVSKAASAITIISLPEERSFRKAFKPINKFKLCIVLLTDFSYIKAGEMDRSIFCIFAFAT